MKLLRGTLDNERLQVQGSNDLMRGGNRSRGMDYVVIEDDEYDGDDDHNSADDDKYDVDVVIIVDVVVVVNYTRRMFLHVSSIFIDLFPHISYRNSSPYPSNSRIRRWNGCNIEDRT
jgi:hypothetical protein